MCKCHLSLKVKSLQCKTARVSWWWFPTPLPSPFFPPPTNKPYGDDDRLLFAPALYEVARSCQMTLAHMRAINRVL